MKSKNGFTLIELLVVLAIVGVLIALATVGLRAAQATQRDTARKDILGQINGMLINYINNGNGAPSTSTFANAYGSGSSSFIFKNPTTAACPNGVADLYINSSCINMDGLTDGGTGAPFVTYHGTCVGSTQVPAIGPSSLNLCYYPTGGSPYQLGVYLENGNYYPIVQ